MLTRHRVVITGVGAVAPNGNSAFAYHDALLAGRSGLSRYSHEGYPPLKTSAVAACVSFDPLAVLEAGELKRVPRMIPMGLAASREALAMAGVKLAADDLDAQRRIGVSLGTGGGGLAFVEEQYRVFFAEGGAGKPSLYSITAGTHGNLSSELSIHLHLRGPSHVLSTGCTSSTDAIGHAMMLIRAGIVPQMVAGGADSPISPGILSAFEKMRVISTRRWDDPTQSSRPFQPDRDGFVLGEGSWMFVLESLESAQQRGARVLAELTGYSSTCDAYHRVQIAPDVAEPVRAIELALADAGLTPEDIGYVNLHGTGTDLNDRLETAAVKRALGDHAMRVPMSATKSMIGHPQGACGAAGLAATVLGLSRPIGGSTGHFHGTLNQDAKDDACDLDYMSGSSRQLDVDHALCNCIAFGSKNSALVVSRFKE